MKTKVSVSSPEKLAFVERICQRTSPYHIDNERDHDFIMAMREVLSWHIDNNQFYKKLIESKNFHIDELKTIEDLKKIPFIFANFFKKYEVLSIPKEDVALNLTSSGTTGQKSQMFFDEWSIRAPQNMLSQIFDHYGWVDKERKVNYLLYTYEPSRGCQLGTAYTDNYLCGYAPVNKVNYALRYMGEGKQHKFDVFGTIKAFQEYAEEGLPVRIFGFPSFFYFTLQTMQKQGIPPIKLHPDSLVFLGGGWKGHQDQAISKKEFYSLVTECLGIPDHRLRDGFGSVEHCIPYVECENHNFHIPVYSEVFIRDVKSLEPLGYGEIGYLNLMAPYITSVPAVNVLMGDLAIKFPAEKCSCSLSTDYFEIVGRAGTTKNRSCAIAATELLKEFQ